MLSAPAVTAHSQAPKSSSRPPPNPAQKCQPHPWHNSSSNHCSSSAAPFGCWQQWWHQCRRQQPPPQPPPPCQADSQGQAEGPGQGPCLQGVSVVYAPPQLAYAFVQAAHIVLAHTLRAVGVGLSCTLMVYTNRPLLSAQSMTPPPCVCWPPGP